MMIPEPTADELSYNLCHFYDDNQNTVFPDRFKNVLISRAYHAEREVAELRARVAELEARVNHDAR